MQPIVDDRFYQGIKKSDRRTHKSIRNKCALHFIPLIFEDKFGLIQCFRAIYSLNAALVVNSDRCDRNECR